MTWIVYNCYFESFYLGLVVDSNVSLIGDFVFICVKFIGNAMVLKNLMNQGIISCNAG